MKFRLKIVFLLVLFFFSAQGFAWTKGYDYVSAFKPVKKNKGIVELQRNIQKDIFQIRSMMNFQKKKIIGLMKDSGNTENKRAPAEI